MYKAIGVLLLLTTVVLLSFINDRKSRAPLLSGKQIIFSYQSESMAYSDLQQLYTPDTVERKKHFFDRNELQYVKGKLACTIAETILQTAKDSQVIVFQVINPELSIDQKGISIDADRIKEEITKPVYATRYPDGRIVSVRTDHAISMAAVSIVKDILSRFQFVSNANTHDHWMAKETNTQGIYTADYKRLSANNDEYDYLKTNRGYDINKAQAHNQSQTVESYSTIHTDSLFNIKKEDITETLVLLAGPDTISASGNKINIQQTSMQFASQQQTLTLYKLLSSPAYNFSSTLSAQLTDAAIKQQAYQHTVGSNSWETLQLEIKNLVNPSNDIKEQLIMKLRALIALQPATCEPIRNWLTTAALGTPAYEILSHALTRAATQAASETMAAVINARKNEKDVMLDLLPQLAVMPDPGPASIDIAKKMGFENGTDADIVSTAELTLGCIANNIQQRQPLQSTAITNYILEKLNNETDTVQKLLILGNTGNHAILPFIKPLIQSEQVSPMVYSRAIKALRFIRESDASDLLQSLSHAKDAQTRELANQVIAFRNDYLERNN